MPPFAAKSWVLICGCSASRVFLDILRCGSLAVRSAWSVSLYPSLASAICATPPDNTIAPVFNAGVPSPVTARRMDAYPNSRQKRSILFSGASYPVHNMPELPPEADPRGNLAESTTAHLAPSAYSTLAVLLPTTPAPIIKQSYLSALFASIYCEQLQRSDFCAIYS